jgi:hypothetical protein
MFAAGLFEDIQAWFASGREVVLAGAGVFLLVAVIAVGVTRRSLLAAFGTLIFGALLLWGMANSSLLSNKAGEDFDTSLGAVAAEAVHAGGVER